MPNNQIEEQADDFISTDRRDKSSIVVCQRSSHDSAQSVLPSPKPEPRRHVLVIGMNSSDDDMVL
jgi:hypothetical protein